MLTIGRNLTSGTGAGDPPCAGDEGGRAGWTVIRVRDPWRLVDLGELWRYRELVWMLALRDIKVRYKQTLIGAAWAIVQPLATMAIFCWLFRLTGAKTVSHAIPPTVVAYTGLLLWQLFSTSFTQSSNSLVDNQAMVKKVYFPRLIFPLAPIVAALVDFAVALPLFAGLVAWYHVALRWTALAAPLFVLLAVITAMAVSSWFSALSAMYRDFRYVVPFLVQLWMLASPVLYETDAVIPSRWRLLYFCNPMAGIVEGFRWSLFGGGTLPWAHLGISMAGIAGVLVSGLWYFRSAEGTLADWV